MQLGDAAQDAFVVPDAELHLHGGDLGDPPGLFDLSHRDVTEADARDQAVALQPGERPHAGRERRTRIGRVQLIQIDPIDAEGAPARLARRNEVPRTAVRDPLSPRAGQAAFGGDQDARTIAAPGGERSRDQPFVVAGLLGIAAVGIGGVEEVDAFVKGRVQHADRARLVPGRLG